MPDGETSQTVLKRFNADSPDDLASIIGSGEITASDVLEQTVPANFLRVSDIGDEKQSDPTVIEFPVKDHGDRSSKAIAIRGLTPGMAVHYSNCCHPLPGDKIIGILTPGKGVAIHTKDCETLESFVDAPERWVEVAWDLGPEMPESRVGRINLIVNNERGVLGTVTTVIAQHFGNISNLKLTNRSVDFFEMVVDIEVESTAQLNDIIAALRTTPEINSVDRAQG